MDVNPYESPRELNRSYDGSEPSDGLMYWLAAVYAWTGFLIAVTAFATFSAFF